MRLMGSKGKLRDISSAEPRLWWLYNAASKDDRFPNAEFVSTGIRTVPGAETSCPRPPSLRTALLPVDTSSRRSISLRGLRRELSLDDETLEDLVEELVEGARVARRDGARLVWADDGRAAPASAPAPRPSGTSGERRHLTVMFCDLVGSTELSQRVDPEELRRILHEYRTICVEETRRLGGHVAQYLGDGVLVYFGYPQASEDQADRALRSALEIRRITQEREFDARIGIHSGLVVVDPDAAGDDALALGPTTNLAARFQGLAKAGTVVVSDETLALCRSLFITRSLGETPVKGVEQPILLHEVERVVGIRSAVEVESRGPMLGREAELKTVRDRWAEALEGRGQAVVVTAEPGMGKSRLVRAFRDTLDESEHLPLVMQCSPYATSSAFQPVVEQLQSRLGLQDAASPEDGRDQLVQGLERVPALAPERVIPYLLPLLGLPASNAYALPQTSADEQRERTLVALLHLVAALSAQQPLLMVAEDLHWADPSTLEYLGRLVEYAEHHPLKVMLLMTSRPEFRSPWPQPRVTQLELQRLSRETTRQLVAGLIEARRLDGLVDEIERRSDGVPLFVEELTAGVLSEPEAGAPDDAQAGGRRLSIPVSLQDALMARLDRLGSAKPVAQEAATIGREFPRALIEAVSDLESSALDHALDKLVAAQILHRGWTGPEEYYTFHHALLQDTAYESQLRSTRKQLHARIVQVLEEAFPKRVESEPELMARHCAAAGLHEAAIAHYVKAAELAISRLSNEEASEHFERALEMLAFLPASGERDQREIGVRVAHMQALVALHGRDASPVLSTYARLEALCEAVGEGPQQIPALISLMTFDATQKPDLPSASRRADALLRIAEPLGVPQLLVVAHTIAASDTLGNGSPYEAADRLGLAIEIGETCEFPPPASANEPDLLSLALGMHVQALSGCGRTDEMREVTAAMYARLRPLDHDLSLVSALANIAGAGYALDDPELCRSGAAEALTVADGRGWFTNEALLLVLHGWARAHLGEVEAGIADVERGLAVEAASGPPLASGYYHVASADVYRLARDWRRAEQLLDGAAAIADGLTVASTSLHYVRGLLCLEFGDERLEEAETSLQRAHALASEVDQRWAAVRYATCLARVAQRTAKVPEAHERLASAYDSLDAGHEHAVAQEARAVREELAALL